MVRRIGFAAVLLLVGAHLLAQGTSPVKVTGISVSPTTFKAGDNVTITVALENTSKTAYGCVGGSNFAVTVYAFKASPYTVTNQVWQGTQALTAPLAPGEKKSVTLSTKFTVPNIDTPTFHFMAWSPVCAPDEFGQTAVLKIDKVCVYKYTPRFEFVRLPLKDLTMLRK